MGLDAFLKPFTDAQASGRRHVLIDAMLLVMAADGDVSKTEMNVGVAFLKKLDCFSGVSEQMLAGMILDGQKRIEGYGRDAVRKVAESAGGDASLKKGVIALGYTVMSADMRLSRDEMAMISKLGSEMGLSESELQEIARSL